MEKSGTFLVTAADGETAVLSSIDDAQVHTLSSNPGLSEGDVVEGTIASEAPLEVTWALVEVEGRRSVAVERLDEPPGDRAREAAAGGEAGDDEGAGSDSGEVGRVIRTGIEGGELHVVRVPEGRGERAAADVVEDPKTLVRAARLGASRVEVRAGEGIVSVRYLE